MQNTIKDVPNDDLLDWFGELCSNEINPHGQISSLPFDMFETRKEIINRMEQSYDQHN